MDVDTTETADWPAVRFDDDGRQAAFTDDEIDRLVPLVAHHLAPRRFALCAIERDERGRPYDVSVLGWGLQLGLTDDSVSVLGYPDHSGQRVRGEFHSAEAAVRVLGGRDDVRLVWVDA